MQVALPKPKLTEAFTHVLNTIFLYIDIWGYVSFDKTSVPLTPQQIKWLGQKYKIEEIQAEQPYYKICK